MAKVAVMGYGVVGSGVCQVIKTHFESIIKKINEPIEIKYILDRKDFPNSEFEQYFTRNFNDILNDDEVKIVAEVMGGVDPAFSYVKKLLLAGKSVVTSNKELVAEKGAELLDVARKNNVNFLFEASVGGGIPIIRPISQCLAANDVVEIAGILNGTTNFILTKMIKEGMTLSDALELAQELGYAERDPSADINGEDACRKICVLAALVYGKHVYPGWVYTEGIIKIDIEDVKFAELWGGVIKLIGQVKKLENGKIDISVEPMFIKSQSQLAGVDDVFNAILVRGDSTGDIVFYGKGAGKLPTASAVVADIIDCVKHMKTRKYLYWEENKDENYVEKRENTFSAFYIRMNHKDYIKAKEVVNEKIGNIRPIYNDIDKNNFAFTTDKISLGKVDELIIKLRNMGIEILSRVKIADF